MFSARIRFCVNVRPLQHCVYYCKTPIKSPNSTEPLSLEEHQKVLETLNEAPAELLARYRISKKRIKGMADYRAKQGPFKSIDEVLEVDGFGQKILNTICQNIITNNLSAETTNVAKHPKQIRNMILPQINADLKPTIQSAVAIHLHPTGIGWLKLHKSDNSVSEWKSKDFSELPIKMLPTDTFQLALDMVKATPIGDVYIFEAAPSLSPQQQTKQLNVTTHKEQVGLMSMLLALINTSPQHNPAYVPSETVAENRVFYLRNKVPARLFKILIGNETVSPIWSITGLVKNDPTVLQSLPCSPVKFDNKLDQFFMSQSSIQKELLAQSLMLGISFFELIIHKNPKCFNVFKTQNEGKS